MIAVAAVADNLMSRLQALLAALIVAVCRQFDGGWSSSSGSSSSSDSSISCSCKCSSSSCSSSNCCCCYVERISVGRSTAVEA